MTGSWQAANSIGSGTQKKEACSTKVQKRVVEHEC